MPVKKAMELKDLQVGDLLICNTGLSSELYEYKVLKIWSYIVKHNLDESMIGKRVYMINVRSNESFSEFSQHRFDWFVKNVYRSVDTLFGEVTQLIMSR